MCLRLNKVESADESRKSKSGCCGTVSDQKFQCLLAERLKILETADEDPNQTVMYNI